MEKGFEPNLAMNFILTVLINQTGMYSPAFFSIFMTGYQTSAQCSIFSKYLVDNSFILPKLSLLKPIISRYNSLN